jgi:sortase A
MRLIVARAPLRWILRWTQRSLVTVGVALLAWCGYVLADTWRFQHTRRRQFESLLVEKGTAPVESKVAQPADDGELLGRLEILRLGVSVIVMEGTSDTTLRHALGHISGTGLPGRSGNVGIAGHRDTFFLPLRNVRRNDEITLTTLSGAYRYRVVSTRIVKPTDVTVLDPSNGEILTLVTCYPFYFIGAAPERFIVRAERSI